MVTALRWDWNRIFTELMIDGLIINWLCIGIELATEQVTGFWIDTRLALDFQQIGIGLAMD